MEPMLRELSAIRIVYFYIEPQKLVSKVRNYYHFKDLEVIFSSNKWTYLWVVGLNEKSLLFVRFWKE